MAQTQSSIYQNTIYKELDLFFSVCECGPARESFKTKSLQSVLFFTT